MPNGWMLVDVDTQIDFMEPTGSLYVPGAETLYPRLRELVAMAAATGAPHLATMDTHTPDDPEFAAYGFPPHCVKATAGWAKVEATRPLGPYLVNSEADLAAERREQVFLKDTFDIFTNPLFRRAIALHAPRTAVVCGVATDYCVKAAVLGLLAAGVAVVVAEDAIAAVQAESGEAAIAEMKAAGARFLAVAAIREQVMEEAAHVA